jgi:hypothetical protein
MSRNLKFVHSLAQHIDHAKEGASSSFVVLESINVWYQHDCNRYNHSIRWIDTVYVVKNSFTLLYDRCKWYLVQFDDDKEPVNKSSEGQTQRWFAMWTRLFYPVIVVFSIVANVILTGIAGIFLDHSQSELVNTIVGSGSRSQNQSLAKRDPQLPTLPPRNSSVDTAGFIHIGKTGGSTISKLLRNGCTSFITGPCRNVTDETVVSKFVVGIRF